MAYLPEAAGGTFRVTTLIWSVGFACPKDTNVGFTDEVMRECESCRKVQPYFWPWTRIGITRRHSRKRTSTRIVMPLRRESKGSHSQTKGDAQSGIDRQTTELVTRS